MNHIFIAENQEHKYKCPKGHSWKAEGKMELVVSISGGEIGRYALCPFCLLNWFKENISPSELVL